MVRQPYVYTMPEVFLTDQAVPVRWRVWAVVNGFFLNNQKCWASNEWIGELIGCHKDSVSQGVRELEDLKMILCERTRRSRMIVPILTEIGDTAYLRGALAPISDRSQRLSISVTNSDNISGASLRIEKESTSERQEKTSRKTTPEMEAVFAVFDDKPARHVWKTRAHEREAAAILAREYGVDELKRRYIAVKKYRDETLCPKIDNPTDFLEKMSKMEHFLKTLQKA